MIHLWRYVAALLFSMCFLACGEPFSLEVDILDHDEEFTVLVDGTPISRSVLPEGAKAHVVQLDFSSYSAAKRAPAVSVEVRLDATTSWLIEIKAGECEFVCEPNGCGTLLRGRRLLSQSADGTFKTTEYECEGTDRTIILTVN